MTPQKPPGFEEYLSAFGPVLHEPYCGEPVAWGFKITRYLGDELFSNLGKHGRLECIDGFTSSWALVIETLSREKAALLYGEITDQVFGPCGGLKSITFGEKKFVHKFLRPERGSENLV